MSKKRKASHWHEYHPAYRHSLYIKQFALMAKDVSEVHRSKIRQGLLEINWTDNLLNKLDKIATRLQELSKALTLWANLSYILY